MELRDYSEQSGNFTLDQRNHLIGVVREHLERGSGMDGTFEFHYLDHASELDLCEYDYLLLIDMGWSQEREDQKKTLAKKIGIDLVPVLGSESVAVRLRLQNAAFVP